MAKIIKTDGSVVKVTAQKGKELSLQQLQDAVEGQIELVQILNPSYQDKIMFCNENGRILGKPINLKATIIAAHRIPIVGNVILCNQGEVS